MLCYGKLEKKEEMGGQLIESREKHVVLISAFRSVECRVMEVVQEVNHDGLRGVVLDVLDEVIRFETVEKDVETFEILGNFTQNLIQIFLSR